MFCCFALKKDIMVSAAHPRFLLDQELQCQGRGVRAMREDSTVYKGLITHLERQIEIK